MVPRLLFFSFRVRFMHADCIFRDWGRFKRAAVSGNPTVRTAKTIRYRYRARSRFAPLKPNPTSTDDSELGQKTKYLRRKRTGGV